MFTLFKQKLSQEPSSKTYNTATERLHVLLQMCVDSAQQTLNILLSLQHQGLLRECYDIYTMAVTHKLNRVIDPV